MCCKLRLRSHPLHPLERLEVISISCKPDLLASLQRVVIYDAHPTRHFISTHRLESQILHAYYVSCIFAADRYRRCVEGPSVLGLLLCICKATGEAIRSG